MVANTPLPEGLPPVSSWLPVRKEPLGGKKRASATDDGDKTGNGKKGADAKTDSGKTGDCNNGTDAKANGSGEAGSGKSGTAMKT
eukprot:5256504-Alexandrium_andersonii.AAC.1